jgi:hydroxymethylpyrimidine pyrophosphatase-like HAD family hydrolase
VVTFKESAVIVDLDGTLTLNGGRDPYDWSKVKFDLPNRPVVLVAQALRSAGQRLVFVSGRSDVCFKDTLKWLRINVHAGTLETDLHMRNEGDFRPDEEVKLDIYRELLEPRYAVRLVLDDRNKVVAMWRELGLTCLQVADAPF